ncbi:hypothetical protein ACFSTC_16740 [Nonomuraea ferruginea]
MRSRPIGPSRCVRPPVAATRLPAPISRRYAQGEPITDGKPSTSPSAASTTASRASNPGSPPLISWSAVSASPQQEFA